MFHHFKDPVMITEGKMQYLFDETGRRYLDVSNHTFLLLPVPCSFRAHYF